jgi:homoserine/homoserine lactone efflux protein
MTLATWITFFLACWAISLSPGPGAIAAMTAGLNQGFKRGYFTVLGLVLGIWTQMTSWSSASARSSRPPRPRSPR